MYYCSYVNLHFLHKDRKLLMDLPINNYITYYTEIVIMIMITRCNFAFFVIFLIIILIFFFRINLRKKRRTIHIASLRPSVREEGVERHTDR